jgi:excisionase family DNA binding protein
MTTQIIEEPQRIESLLNHLQIKEILSFSEACEFLNLSASYLYKLTSTQKLPHYKPNGKKIYFRRGELQEWLLKNRIKPLAEIEKEALDYVVSKKKGGVR